MPQFRRLTLRARMALLYGAVICASGVALLGVTQTLAPGLLGHPVHRKVTSQPGTVPAGHPTRIPLTIGSEAFWGDVVTLMIMAVCSIAVGWLIAGRFVRPLRSIITNARDISASNLHQRLGVRGRGDEFTELGQTLDDLFGRLEASFQAQRHFIANASHELRTPLSAGLALLQVAIADPEPTVETLRATCQELVELGDQQEQLIAALLALASSQRGIGQLECLDLADITQDVVVARQDEAGHHGVQLSVTLGPAPVTGDARLAESLVANLLDNAIRHNLPGGQVQISTALTAAGAVVSVRNTGTIIPPDAVADLFQPFRQLGTERTRRGEGYGLGLAIVRAIADAHGAALTASARPQGGLDIEVSFPLHPLPVRGHGDTPRSRSVRQRCVPKREDGEATRRDHRAGTEPCDSRARDRHFCEVIPGSRRGRALPVVHSQVNRGHHDAVGTHPGHVGGKLHPGVMPGHVDQLAVAVHLGVSGTSSGRAVGLLVIVPGPDRDPQRHANRHPARMDELSEILAGPGSLLDQPPAQPKAPT